MFPHEMGRSHYSAQLFLFKIVNGTCSSFSFKCLPFLITNVLKETLLAVSESQSIILTETCQKLQFKYSPLKFRIRNILYKLLDLDIVK